MGYIDRLVVHNFKSYAGEQVIGPFHAFTAIIGPNGSGKSNLMDAISFVLRVKTEVMRGKRMSELVHRGPSRHPSGTAFVKLVFVTDEEQQIEFCRTITASGSSEFRVDNRVVKKDEYDACLERLDILVKARNFLVFQGDVQNIAQKSAKELSQLVENISGSGQLGAEYGRLLQEKEDLEEQTIFNFQKKKTCTAERRHFKSQKDEAEKFEKLVEAQAQVRQEQALFRLFYIERDLRKHQDHHAKSTGEYDEVQGAVEELHETLAELKKEKAQAQKAQVRCEANLRKLRSRQENAAPDMVKCQENIRAAEEKISETLAQLAKKRADREAQAREVTALRQELENLRVVANEYQQEWDTTQAGLDFRLSRRDQEEYLKIKQEAAQETARLQHELSVVEARQRAAQQETRRLRVDHEEMVKRRDHLRENLTVLEERSDKVAAQAERIRASEADTRERLDQLRADNSRAAERQRKLNAKLQRTQESLQEARVYRHETQREALYANALETLKRLFSGVKGRLWDLCRAPQRKYAVPVQVAMGRHADSIVVEDRETAVACIQYLKQERLATCVFIPLDAVHAPPLDVALRQLGGSKRLVHDVIEFDPALRRAVLYAVGNTVVCDTLQEARELRFGTDGTAATRVKCVTLDGSLIHKSGMMTGGVSGVEGVAQRYSEAEVGRLQRRRDECVEELCDLGRTMRSQAHEEHLATQLETLAGTQEHVAKDLAMTAAKRDELAGQLAVVEKDLRKLNAQLARLAGEAEGSERKALLQQIEEAEAGIFEAFSRRVGVENIRQKERQRLEAKREYTKRMTEFENQKARLENQLEYEEKRDIGVTVARLEGRIAEEEEHVEKLRAALTGLARSQDGLGEKLGALEAQVAQEHERVQAVVQQTKERKREADKLAKQLTDITRKITAHESEMYALRNQRRQILRDCKLSQIDLPLSDDAEMADVDVPMGTQTLDAPQTQSESADAEGDAGAGERVALDYSSLRKNLRNIKRSADYDARCRDFEAKLRSVTAQLENIAPNMKAIEQYHSVENRLDEAQRNFEEARSRSREAGQRFHAVREQRKERFMEAFSHIQENIDKIYKELTKRGGQHGGNAYLSVENPDEPYLSGIKYNAMPPRKRFSDLDQLSGGEKTVAALALIFAIHSYQPSPFFVLDEVDAALDPNNVNRVAKYVKSRVEENAFQCIVISLKDQFFEKCDALIGIFRDQKQECSRTLTLNLAERFEE